VGTEDDTVTDQEKNIERRKACTQARERRAVGKLGLKRQGETEPIRLRKKKAAERKNGKDRP